MDIAGYDVNAAPAFWEKMTDGKSAEKSDFCSTHPSDSKRIAALKEAISTKPTF
jgi:predicted Zn-dependent protease